MTTQMRETNARPGKGNTPVQRRWAVFERNAQANAHIADVLAYLDKIGVEYRMTDDGLEMIETAYVANPGDGMKSFPFHGALAIGSSDRDHIQMILAGNGHRSLSWREKVALAQRKEARAAETAAHGRPIDTADAVEQAERQIAGIGDPKMKARMLRMLAEFVDPDPTPPAAPVAAPVAAPLEAPEGLSDADIDKAIKADKGKK